MDEKLFAALIKDYKESGTKLSEVSMGEKAALIASVTGIFGVLAAYYIVKSMPVNILTYIVAVVLIYMAISFMISNKKDRENNAK